MKPEEKLISNSLNSVRHLIQKAIQEERKSIIKIVKIYQDAAYSKQTLVMLHNLQEDIQSRGKNE